MKGAVDVLLREVSNFVVFRKSRHFKIHKILLFKKQMIAMVAYIPCWVHITSEDAEMGRSAAYRVSGFPLLMTFKMK